MIRAKNKDGLPLSLLQLSSRNISLKPIEAVLISIHKELFYCLSANKSPL